ncbi:MAG: hypothetical protein PVG30_01900 [Gammaproteobacteria bacterium]
MREFKQAMLNLEKAKEEYSRQYSKLTGEIKEIIDSYRISQRDDPEYPTLCPGTQTICDFDMIHVHEIDNIVKEIMELLTEN